MIRSREVSSREVVQSHLGRIDAVNGEVNAVTLVLADEALAAADDADRAPAAGPLHGVPFTVKENIDCAGSATTQGVPALATNVPAADAVVVARMRAAGAIPLARTNLPEFAMRVSTDNPLRGRTVNPWDRTRTAGGSSGGDAAALATGMTPFGLGNDIGGSVRNPAFCCGVTALKPTIGRLPMAGAIPFDMGIAVQLMATEGPMARTVRDLRVGLEIMAGRDARDPRTVDVPLDGPAPATRVAALVIDVPGVSVPASFAAAVRRAGEALEGAGWKVVEASPPDLALVTELWRDVLAATFRTSLELMRPLMSVPAARLLEQLVGGRTPEVDQLFMTRRRLQRQWSEHFAQHPILVGPTWTGVAFEHDADVEPITGTALTLDRLRFITPGNVLGFPSTAVPTGIGDDGLPLGVQVYADLWRDDLSLEGAQAVEDALGTITPIDPR